MRLLVIFWLFMDPAVVVNSQYVPPGRSQWIPWQGSYPRPVVGSAQGSSRQVSQEQRISVQCEEQEMVVNVQRDLFGTGKLVKATDMTLGPQLCPPSSQSTDTTLIFQAGLHECGNRLQMTQDWLVYNTNLTYSPTPSRNSPIIRTNPAVVLIQCYYPRYGNVSSKPIKPTWVPFSSTVSVEEKLSFSLYLMTDDWSSQRTSTVFQLGDIFHIEASVDTGNHVPMTIYVDSCVATLSPDVNANPRYEIIALNGCLLDGKLEDSSSAFISPRPQPDKLQFMIDAFRFTGIDASMIYITCHLRAAAATQAPNSLNKACSFSKTSNIWSPVEGPSNTCSCCETGNCAATAGQSRRNNPPQNRRPWRREAALDPDSEQAFATLGPLLVVGPPHNKASATRQESKQMAEIWMLVAVGVLCLVVISTCIIVTVSRISKRRVFLQTVQK
ncbi:zona pellucida sperm-binding protein 3-like [Ascaphus truei]|uniref:zona pellucida sperm-binding protein 3-like n=1 Tax=Ascaphus truei TaxID=8439 RepID=UPI003F5AA7F8